MSHNSVLEFKWGDGSPYCAIYVHSDTYIEEFIPELLEIFTKLDEDSSYRGRLNWDFLVSDVVKFLLGSRSKNKIVRPDGHEEDKSFINRYIISPVSDLYVDKDNYIGECVNVSVKNQFSEEWKYEGALAEYNPDKTDEQEALTEQKMLASKFGKLGASTFFKIHDKTPIKVTPDLSMDQVNWLINNKLVVGFVIPGKGTHLAVTDHALGVYKILKLREAEVPRDGVTHPSDGECTKSYRLNLPFKVRPPSCNFAYNAEVWSEFVRCGLSSSDIRTALMCYTEKLNEEKMVDLISGEQCVGEGLGTEFIYDHNIVPRDTGYYGVIDKLEALIEGVRHTGYKYLHSIDIVLRNDIPEDDVDGELQLVLEFGLKALEEV